MKVKEKMKRAANAYDKAREYLLRKHIQHASSYLQHVQKHLKFGSYFGDPNAVPNTTEVVTGGTSGDSVDTYEVFKYLDAPYHYYIESDSEKRITDNGVFIIGGTPSSDLKYITNREHIETSNEERSNMRVIDPEYISEFVDKFEELLNNE